MPKLSHRDRLLQKGFKVVLCHGYSGASVRDIVRAAGVPQGSFTNHFASKEAFTKEVLEGYFAMVRGNIQKTLRNDKLPPLRRLRTWFDVQIAFLKKSRFRSGCLIGNLCIEAGDLSQPMRRRLAQMIREIDGSIIYCLKAAAAARQLPASANPRELARFLHSSWHGAILQSKVDRSIEPLMRFTRMTFRHVLN